MRYALIFTSLLLLSGCAKTGQSGRSPADTLSQRQRDSALGASKVPGARGIQKALQAQDSAAARNARLDSIQ